MYLWVWDSNLKNLKLYGSSCSECWVRYWRWPAFPELVEVNDACLLPVEQKWATRASKQTGASLRSWPREPRGGVRRPCRAHGECTTGASGLSKTYRWLLETDKSIFETDIVIHFTRSWRERFPVLQGLWRTQKSSHKKSVSFKPLPDTEDTTTSSGQSQSGENLSCHSPLPSRRDSQMVGEGHYRQENNNDKTTRPCFPLQLAHLT